MAEFTSGQVTDLISNDVQRMEEAVRAFTRILISCYDMLLSVLLIWYFVGWQALAGLGSFVLLVPFGFFLASITGKFRKKTAEVTDRRVHLMTEIVAAIRAVKTHAWEWIYRQRVAEIRR